MNKIFSAFTGIGSPEIALDLCGKEYEIVGISEVDKHAILAYDAIHDNPKVTLNPDKETCLKHLRDINVAYNFSSMKDEMPKNECDIKTLYNACVNNRNFGDIRTIDVDTLPDFDTFVYSFPCKNISVQGQQHGLADGSDTQSSLVWECLRIIKDKLPDTLVMENVKNIVGKAHIGDFNDWIGELDKLGYKSEYRVLNAYDYGLPQNRERVILISTRKDIDLKAVFDHDAVKGGTIESILDESVTNDSHLYYPDYKVEIFNEPKVNVKTGLIHSAQRCDWKPHACGRIYSVAGSSPTLTSMNGGDRQPKVLVGNRARKLNTLECWRLMGIPDELHHKAKKAGISDTKLYERSGRAIAIPMLKDLFSKLF